MPTISARAEGAARAAAIRKMRKADLDNQIDRLVDAIAQTGISGALRQRLLEAENEVEALRSKRNELVSETKLPADLIGRYKRLMVDLRGALGRDAGRSREILRDLLGEIRLQPEGEELYAVFETRPERIVMTERIASNCGCGDRI